MSNIFNPENGFFTAVNKIVDLFWLGLLWCVLGFGLAIIGFFMLNDTLFTAGIIVAGVMVGPSTCSLYYAMVKVIRRSRSYATREFFRAFKLNFKIAAPMSAIYSVFAYLMFVDFQYANMLMDQQNNLGNVLFFVFLAGSLFALVSLLWVFPILSRFTVTLSGLFRNALLISTKHIIRTLLLIILGTVIGVLVYIFQAYLLYMFMLVPLIPGLVALVSSFIIEPVLKKYTAESEGTEEETGVDEWYKE